MHSIKPEEQNVFSQLRATGSAKPEFLNLGNFRKCGLQPPAEQTLKLPRMRKVVLNNVGKCPPNLLITLPLISIFLTIILQIAKQSSLTCSEQISKKATNKNNKQTKNQSHQSKSRHCDLCLVIMPQEDLQNIESIFLPLVGKK